MERLISNNSLLVENLQRDDLTPKETSEAIQKALKVMSARELAKKIGKTQTICCWHNWNCKVTLHFEQALKKIEKGKIKC